MVTFSARKQIDTKSWNFARKMLFLAVVIDMPRSKFSVLSIYK